MWASARIFPSLHLRLRSCHRPGLGYKLLPALTANTPPDCSLARARALASGGILLTKASLSKRLPLRGSCRLWTTEGLSFLSPKPRFTPSGRMWASAPTFKKGAVNRTDQKLFQRLPCAKGAVGFSRLRDCHFYPLSHVLPRRGGCPHPPALHNIYNPTARTLGSPKGKAGGFSRLRGRTRRKIN